MASKDEDVAVDSTLVLHDDVLASVFSWLDTTTLMRAVPAVCRRWRDVLPLMTNTTLALNWKGSPFEPPPTRLGKEWGDFVGPEPPVVFSPEGQRLLAKISSRFGSVAALDLSGVYWPRYERAAPDPQRLARLIALFPNLESIDFSGSHWMTDADVLLLTNFPKLVAINLYGCYKLTKDVFVELVNRRPTISSIGGSFGSDATLTAVANGCERLVSVQGLHPTTSVMVLAQHASSLRTLRMEQGPTIDKVAELLSHLPNLEVVSFGSYQTGVDEAVATLAKNCPRLRAVFSPSQLQDIGILVDLIMTAEHLTTVSFPYLSATRDLVAALVERADRIVKVRLAFDPRYIPRYAHNQALPNHRRALVTEFPKWMATHDTHATSWAVEKGYTETLVMLLGAGANVDGPENLDPTSPLPLLIRATVTACSDMVQVLLDANATVDKPAFKGGGSPLAIATWMGHTDIMRQLLAAGADPHAVSAANDGDTPILIAERSGDAEVMKVLGLEVADQGVNDWKFPSESMVGASSHAHLFTPCSAVELSNELGEWFSFHRDGGIHPDLGRCEWLALTRTDLVHRPMSELPESVQTIAEKLHNIMKDISLGAGDGDSPAIIGVISGETADTVPAILRALGIKRAAWRWATHEQRDYATANYFSYEEEELDPDDHTMLSAVQNATAIIGETLVEHFEITFSDEPVYMAPILYGGRHKETGCLVTVMAIRPHGD